jgi:hypothetical protein
MANAPVPVAPRVSAVLLVIVALALLVGAAASLVAGAASAPSYQPGPIQDVFLTTTQLATVFGIGFAVVLGLLIWIYIDRRQSVGGRAALVALMIVLAMVLFVVLLHFASGGPAPLVSGHSAGSNNSTSSGTGTPHNNSTVIIDNPGPTLGFAGIHIPSWAIFALVGGVAAIAAAFVAPALWRRTQDPEGRRGGSPVELERTRGALRSAASALDAGEDPRDVILRLYGELLARVAPIVGGVDPDTPEEIRTTHLVALGIHPESAESLTRLFEEARYSSHPLGEDAASRARSAISIARADLDRVRPEP